ncbi:Hemerythrin HHE cation binding domain [Fragilaria crotonensis]|nr:Hemerythrin HHE cation binding domain [Fragilaria crotonensis]
MKCVLPLLPVVVLLKSATAAFNGTDITSAPFDPTEPVYQIHDKYPPVMTSTWTYGVQHDGWWIAHEALRGEVNDFQMALESLVSIPSASTVPAATAVTDHSVVVIAMQKWWRGHLKHMHSHHRNEDRIIKRFATQRFRWPDFVENDHQEILQRLDAIDTLVQRIVEIGTSVASSTGSDNTDRISPPSDNIVTCITELKSLWTDYNRVILQHLDQEEEVCIALMRAYFHPKHVQRMQHRLGMMGPAVEMGAIVHYVGEVGMKESMKAQKTPRIMEAIGWNLILKPRHRHYVKAMVNQLEILKHARLV